jgi:hypothetical protein
METKYKVKIVKTSSYTYNDYGDSSYSSLWPVTADWEVVDGKTRAELAEAVRYANIKNKDDWVYVLVEYSEDDSTKSEVFKLASDFLEKQKRDVEREEKNKADVKRKRDDTAIARKKKQLAKLQEELGLT